MRVIGGTFGGRRLRAVEGHVTRPTSDRVREALFSRLEARYGLEGSSVLDVFAGTGALAIEALSRGASRAVCIELERRAIETLRGNLRELELVNKVRVMGDDYRRVLVKLAQRSDVAAGAAADDAGARHEGRAPATPASRLAQVLTPESRRFDGVFIDPPYGKGLALEALAAVAEFSLVKTGGWVTVEVGRRELTPEDVEGPKVVLKRVREDTYGDTKLALYEALARVAQNEHVGDQRLPTAEVER
jgi:16S rRNA (guanine966-N2)-methyltransferase